MSNTALYQCEKCGYSTNNPVAFDIHLCRPSNSGKLIAAILAIVLAVSLFVALPVKAHRRRSQRPHQHQP